METKKRLNRIVVIAIILLVVSSGAWLWAGWQHAISNALGAFTIVMIVSLTFSAVSSVFGKEKAEMKRSLWIKLIGVICFLALAVTVMAFVPWIRRIPLLVGLSVFLPAMLIELVINQIGEKKHEN